MIQKKVRAFVKIDNSRFFTWHVTNLISFCKFLDKRYSDWRYFNLYDCQTNEQIASYSKNNRPKTEWIT